MFLTFFRLQLVDFTLNCTTLKECSQSSNQTVQNGRSRESVVDPVVNQLADSDVITTVGAGTAVVADQANKSGEPVGGDGLVVTGC